MKKRILSALLLSSMLLSLLAVKAPRAHAACENIHENTGNQAQDLIAVALTQVGYTEGKNNDTKYCDWMGYPNQPWCAIFISWCADQADIPHSVLKPSAWASPGSKRGFNIPYYAGTDYTPKAGDLFFTEEFEHVGIVIGVDGENFITVEGNTNDDGSDEGYGVLVRSRVIAECWFGVPAYQGAGEEHNYVRQQDAAHPHTIRYVCTHCGNSHSSGSKGYDLSCAKCKTCSCDTGKSGWYRVKGANPRLSVRAGHGTSYTKLGHLENGEAVYVHAMGNGWAHITYGGSPAYISSDYLERAMPAPWQLSTAQGFYEGDEALITWHDTYAATSYAVKVYRDGLLLESASTAKPSHTLPEMAPGQYRVTVTATDGSYVSDPSVLNFTVLDTYTLTFDANGGANAPGSQLRYADKPLSLSQKVPSKEGFRFLGWVEDPAKTWADFRPGDIWQGSKDTTLYALWQRQDAKAIRLEIHTPAQKLSYAVGQKLDTTGLQLKLIYDDGTAEILSGGFSAGEFSNKTPGATAVTLTYGELQVSYEVQILEGIPGDMDSNLTVDKEDVMHLLWHVSFPEMYPLEAVTDFTGDGITDKEDVMHLLWHVSFPEMYPLFPQ